MAISSVISIGFAGTVASSHFAKVVLLESVQRVCQFRHSRIQLILLDF